MKLYSVPLSPFAARVRLSVYRKGIERPGSRSCGRRREGRRATPSWASTPWGRFQLCCSTAALPSRNPLPSWSIWRICSPTPSLRPLDIEDLARARLFLRLPDLYFQNAPRTLLGMRDPASRKPALVEEAFGHLNRGLSYIDHYLEGGAWAVGDRASIADSAIIPVLNVLTLVAAVYRQDDLLTKFAKIASYWEAARNDPVHARVIGEQMAAVPKP